MRRQSLFQNRAQRGFGTLRKADVPKVPVDDSLPPDIEDEKKEVDLAPVKTPQSVSTDVEAFMQQRQHSGVFGRGNDSDQ